MAYNQEQILNTISEICATNPEFAAKLSQIAGASQKTSANASTAPTTQAQPQTTVQAPATNNVKNKLAKGYGILGAAAAFSSVFFSYALGGSAFSFLGLTGIGASFALGGVVAGAFVVGLPVLAFTGKLIWSGIKKLGGIIGTGIKSFFSKLRKNKQQRKFLRKQNQSRRKLALVKSNILKENTKALKKQDKNAWKMIANFNKDVIKASKKYNLVYIKASALGKRKNKDKWLFALISKKPDKNGNWILYSPHVSTNGLGKKLIPASTFEYGKNIRPIEINDYFQNDLDTDNFLVKDGIDLDSSKKGERKTKKNKGKSELASPTAAGTPKINIKEVDKKQVEEIDKSPKKAVEGDIIKELTSKQIEEISKKIQLCVGLSQTLEKYPEQKAAVDAQIKEFVKQITQVKEQIKQTGDINQKLEAQSPAPSDAEEANKGIKPVINLDDSPVNTATPEPVQPLIEQISDDSYKLRDPKSGIEQVLTLEQANELMNQYQADKQAYENSKTQKKAQKDKEDKKRK